MNTHVTSLSKGDICLINLNGQIGCEQQGTRPCIVVQNNTGNLYSGTTIICPLTTKQKSMRVTHVRLTTDDADLISESTVLCEQVRVIDKSRIERKLGTLHNKNKSDEIDKKILFLFGISPYPTHSINQKERISVL